MEKHVVDKKSIKESSARDGALIMGRMIKRKKLWQP
jgi:hypothetical protein